MKTFKIKEICHLEKGKQIDTTLLSDGNPYKYINGGIKESGYYTTYNTEGEAVLVSEGGASCGYVNYINEKFWCGCHCYKLTKCKFLPKYIYYALKGNQEKLMALRTGAAMPNIKKTTFQDMELLLNENHTEQELVIKELDKIQIALEIKKTELIALDDLVKSRFIEMFGAPVENPKGWDKKPLSDECKIITGNTPSRKNADYYGNFIEWIKSDNINTPNAWLTTASEFLSEEGLKVGRSVEKDCILMTCIAGSIGCIGNVSVTDRKVTFNQQINGIIPNKNNVWYLYVLFELSKSYIQSTVTMALKGILSKGQLSKIEFIFPPIELQNEFADFVKLTDKSEFVERFPELSLFYRLFSPLNSEMICIFPYFCPYAESAREIREIFS